MRAIARFLYDGTPIDVASGSNILAPAVTSTTQAISYDGNGGIVIKVPGLYKFTACFTAVATAIGDVEVQMLANGSAVPAASAEASFAAVGDFATLPIVALKTVKLAQNGYATVTFQPSAATSIDVSSIIVEQVG